jgi:hypothetical protein
MSQDNSTPLPAVNGIIMPATCYRFIAEQIGTTKYTKSNTGKTPGIRVATPI